MLCLLVKATDLDFFQVRFLLGERLVRPFREPRLAAGVPNAPVALQMNFVINWPATRFSREKPGVLQDFLDMQSPSHKTINVQFKCLLSSRIFSGGDVHVAFVVGNVCERLAVQETGGHATKISPDVDGGTGLHLGT